MDGLVSAALEVGGFLWRGGWAAERRLRGCLLRSLLSLSRYAALQDWAMWLYHRELKPLIWTRPVEQASYKTNTGKDCTLISGLLE